MNKQTAPRESQMQSIAAFGEGICFVGLYSDAVNSAKPLGVGQSWGQRGLE